MRLIEEERAKALKIGQRMVLQQFCIEKEADIKQEIDNIVNSDAHKELEISGFWELLEKWMTGFEIYLPSEIFEKYP